ncbi:transglutaminase-like domain-containing protein [Archangium lipolyticum]|uniref:transglutaminase-like domain-containing protein n=1 Tax=Archangium lipolyticum TaxID=2970465 RepID=UPI00214A1F57|nr:transglutaminase-like domain-containing protein [Archangium lipolyticum]
MHTPPSRPGKRLLALFLVLLVTTSCFALLGLRWFVSRDVHALASPQEPEPPLDLSSADGVHLGVALIPPSTPLSQGRTHEWRAAPLVPSQHRLVYGLGESLADSLSDEHHAYGHKMRFRALGPNRFTYHAPPGCQEDMRCIYNELMRSNAEPVRVLGTRFVQHIRERNLDPIEAAELIVTFVQHIHYEEPADQPFGILPPALVPSEDRGDCDSKAVLAVMLLRQAGIDAAILYSDPLSHAAVGIALPVRGPPFRLGSRVYRYAELTTEGWPLGMIPPQHDKPHLWKVLPPPELSDETG